MGQKNQVAVGNNKEFHGKKGLWCNSQNFVCSRNSAGPREQLDVEKSTENRRQKRAPLVILFVNADATSEHTKWSTVVHLPLPHLANVTCETEPYKADNTIGATIELFSDQWS